MFWTNVTSTLLMLIGVFMIFIILLQRGRGGGLAGAFGGLGGQSAFGTKAGDVFTKITVGLALCWVALAGITGFAMVSESGTFTAGSESSPENSEFTAPVGEAPAGEELDAAGEELSPFGEETDAASEESDAAGESEESDAPAEGDSTSEQQPDADEADTTSTPDDGADESADQTDGDDSKSE